MPSLRYVCQARINDRGVKNGNTPGKSKRANTRQVRH